MNRLFTPSLLLFALLLAPAPAFAQDEPPATREIKDAEKHLAFALIRSTPEERRPLLEQALERLHVAMQKNPDNGRVWLMAGTVYAQLGNYAAADSAFTRAVELHQPYADQVRTERHEAWESAYYDAVQQLAAQRLDEALAGLAAAETVFNERPEAPYYMGLIYMQRGELDHAQAALQAAIAAVNGPLRPDLKPEAAEEWDRLAESARIKLASLAGIEGAKLYDQQKYDEAAAAFLRARAMNPASRDHLFNRMHAMHAELLDLDKKRAAGKSAALDQRARTLHASIVALSDTLRGIEPRNESTYILTSRAHHALSQLATAPAQKIAHAEALRDVNSEYEKLSFLVDEVRITEGDTTVVVSGNVVNKLLKPGAAGDIAFDILGLDGTPVGSAVVNFIVPAEAEGALPFSKEIPVSRPVAGWRYRVEQD